MIEDAIYAILSGDTAVAALASNRIYPLVAPERDGATRPYAVYTTISETREPTVNGANGFVSARIQVDCVGSGYDSARKLSKYVADAFEDYRGTAGGHYIQRIRLENRSDSYEFETEGSEQPIVIVTMDFVVVYGEH